LIGQLGKPQSSPSVIVDGDRISPAVSDEQQANDTADSQFFADALDQLNNLSRLTAETATGRQLETVRLHTISPSSSVCSISTNNHSQPAHAVDLRQPAQRSQSIDSINENDELVSESQQIDQIYLASSEKLTADDNVNPAYLVNNDETND
jgi:hypothetical protein